MTGPRAQDVPLAIQWHEGMMLAPQHFQQLALRQEGLLAYGLRSAAPYHWGIRQLAHDDTALGEGTLRISQLEAIMPDGLLVHAGPNDIPDLPLDEFADDFERGPLTIYLTVPVRRTGGAADPESPQRFRSVNGPTVVDESTGASELAIARLQPRLGLAAAGRGELPPDDRFISLPIMALERRHGTIAPGDYHPPLLALTKDWPIGQRCLDLIRGLREKGRFLVQRAATVGRAGDSDVARQARADLHALIAGLPPFEAMVNANICHPFTVYLALAGLAGQMSGLATEDMPPVLDNYDQNDIKPAFDRLFGFVEGKLAQVRQSYVEHRFVFDGRRFWFNLEKRFMAPQLTVGLRLPAGRREPDIVTWMEQALIGSESRIKTLTGNRVLGAPRRRIERDDALGLLPPRDMVLFHIDTDPQAIRDGEPLFIWRSQDTLDAPRPSEIILFAAGDGEARDDGGRT
jgi:type VI secretion system protein ImpJ